MDIDDFNNADLVKLPAAHILYLKLTPPPHLIKILTTKLRAAGITYYIMWLCIPCNTMRQIDYGRFVIILYVCKCKKRADEELISDGTKIFVSSTKRACINSFLKKNTLTVFDTICLIFHAEYGHV